MGDTVRVIIDCAAYVDGKRFDIDHDAGALRRWESDAVGPDCGADGAFVWLGLRVPDEQELGEMSAALGIDDVSPSEILKPHRRPVLSIDGLDVQLVLRTALYDDLDEEVDLGEMTLLVNPTSVVSIRHGKASELGPVRNALERDPERLQLGPMAVLTAVIERVVRDYGPALDGFENDVLEAELDVFSEVHRQPVERIYRLKREVRQTLVAFDSLQDPLKRLIRAFAKKLPEELVADLSEAVDELDRAVTRAQSLSELIDAALTASLTQIGVQQNNDMRKISAWVAMAAVPTMIAGIFGMNFEHMPELGTQYGYPIVLGVMATTGVVLYRVFKRSGWL
ncbi:MAG: magnesium and cobalt transport protein CorA [Ilumatobacter sp.]|uniref:magnesium and cobalt transport protein CorA n=1 Tax=Ilumatobacter sp. TaxID=1967498 RepID=UPI003C76614C